MRVPAPEAPYHPPDGRDRGITYHQCSGCSARLTTRRSTATGRNLYVDANTPGRIHTCLSGLVAVIRIDGHQATVEALGDALPVVQEALRGRLSGPAAAVPAVAARLSAAGVVAVIARPAPVVDTEAAALDLLARELGAVVISTSTPEASA